MSAAELHRRAGLAAAAADWDAVELAAQRCLWLALEQHYARQGAPTPDPPDLPADLAGRDPAAGALLRRLLRAPDARARLIFLEDLLARLTGAGTTGVPGAAG